ncbi:MAG: GNAT family N-acetyltransferase [Roseiflexaceae bacterium]
MVMSTITLRPVEDADLEIFFQQQCEPDGIWMAAFTAEDPTDRAQFDRHWAKIRADPGITMRAILADGVVVSNIACHGWFGDPEISYGILQAFWGRGIATSALEQFLVIVSERPLYARIASDNQRSRRVLERHGFKQISSEWSYANARKGEIEEAIFQLDRHNQQA